MMRLDRAARSEVYRERDRNRARPPREYVPRSRYGRPYGQRASGFRLS
jgi:hypothetical protein